MVIIVQPAVSTVVIKIRLHCDGCAHKIKRTVLKNIDGELGRHYYIDILIYIN